MPRLGPLQREMLQFLARCAPRGHYLAKDPCTRAVAARLTRRGLITPGRCPDYFAATPSGLAAVA
jgi:hypothetical protein